MRSGDPMLYHCRSFDVEGRLPGRLALINTDDKPGTAAVAGSFEKKIFSSSFCALKWPACPLLSHYQSSEPFLSPVRLHPTFLLLRNVNYTIS
jgi:hypothetical protein